MSSDDEGSFFPGQDLLLAAGRTGGPEELQTHLKELYSAYRENRAAGWPALLAVALIAREAWSRTTHSEMPDTVLDEIDPWAPVDMPWWVVQALAIAYCRHETEQVSIDQALGLARLERGRRSPIESSNKALEELGLAREIASRLEQSGNKIKVDSVVDDVCICFGVSKSKGYAAWKKHGERARLEARAVINQFASR